MLSKTEFHALVKEYIDSCEVHSAAEIERTLFQCFEASGSKQPR